MIPEVYITDIAAFLPNEPVTNKEMEELLGQVGERPSRIRPLILRRNQIATRHYAIDPATGKLSHTNAQLAACAIRKLAGSGRDLNKIELLACGTTLPDQLIPNHALMVHGELGIPPCEAVATAGVCLSGIAALKYAYLAIRAGESGTAVATGSENASSIMQAKNFFTPPHEPSEKSQKLMETAFEKDFLRWMLSDGAGAVWLSNRPNPQGLSLRLNWIKQKSYAGELPACMYAGAEKMADGSLKGWRQYRPDQWLSESIFVVKQDVKLLNEKIIEYTVTKPLRDLIRSGQLNPKKIDWYLPHYSSGFFRKPVYEGMAAAGCEIPEERWFTNLESKGNTGSASIYIILEELFKSGRLKKGETILCYIPESGRFSTAFMELTVI